MTAGTIALWGSAPAPAEKSGRTAPLEGLRRALGELWGTLVLLAAFLTNTGTGMVIDWADGTIASPHTEYLGWGTSATTAAKADTNLGTAATEARVAASRSQTTITNTGDAYSYTGTITADGAKTIKEVAVFSAAGSGSPPSGGTCIIHANHTDATMGAAGDKVDYSISLQLTN